VFSTGAGDPLTRIPLVGVKRVLIIGAGRLGQAAADILLRTRKTTQAVEPAGFVDDEPALLGWQYLGVTVLGGVAAMANIPHDEVLIALGDNAARFRLHEQLARSGEKLATARHSDAVVARDAVVGPGTIICARSVVGPRVVIGANSILHSGCCIAHGGRLGKHVSIGSAAYLAGEVVVEDGARVGADVTILARRRVGAWSCVFDGLVVQRDVPNSLVVSDAPVGRTVYGLNTKRSRRRRESGRVHCLRPIG
jgi:sugar O-acyltransferase (sialic acid O-acetyltransferase NeuD family)